VIQAPRLTMNNSERADWFSLYKTTSRTLYTIEVTTVKHGGDLDNIWDDIPKNDGDVFKSVCYCWDGFSKVFLKLSFTFAVAQYRESMIDGTLRVEKVSVGDPEYAELQTRLNDMPFKVNEVEHRQTVAFYGSQRH
jgi:hypothetical protein